MHEVLNGLNPRGDAALLEALGFASAAGDAEPARQRLRLAASVIVAPITPAKRAVSAARPMLRLAASASSPAEHERRE